MQSAYISHLNSRKLVCPAGLAAHCPVGITEARMIRSSQDFFGMLPPIRFIASWISVRVQSCSAFISSCAAALKRSIPIIVPNRTSKEMIRITARRVVALMADAQTRGYGSTFKYESYAMGMEHFTRFELAVAAFSQAALPLPTFVRRAN